MRINKFPFPCIAAVALLLAPIAYGGAASEPRVEPRVTETIQKMVDYFASAESLTFKIATITEDVSSTLQKLQFDSTLKGAIQRPNKIFIEKSGNQKVSLWFDGEVATILDREGNRYAKIPVNGDLSDLVAKLDDLGIETPFAGLLDRNLLDHVEKHVFKGDYYGPAEIHGTPVIHLALRQDKVDWQLWTDAIDGSPKKVVITSKLLAAAPEHMLLIEDISANTGVLSAKTFVPEIPADAVEVPIQADDSESIRDSSW